VFYQGYSENENDNDNEKCDVDSVNVFHSEEEKAKNERVVRN
jgi:hypothetical protein